ncbi:MAG: hypothetical protein AB7G68_20625 [Nitrospiraceae bacterium]
MDASKASHAQPPSLDQYRRHKNLDAIKRYLLGHFPDMASFRQPTFDNPEISFTSKPSEQTHRQKYKVRVSRDNLADKHNAPYQTYNLLETSHVADQLRQHGSYDLDLSLAQQRENHHRAKQHSDDGKKQ